MEGQTIKKKTDIEDQEPEDDIIAEANEAKHRALIASTRIKEERAKQEEIKTAEIKKELAPISLVKYYFSFSENLLQRLYRRPHEIEPQLEALYMAHEGKKATQLIVRELESIVVQCKQELEKAIGEEGYRVHDKGK